MYKFGAILTASCCHSSSPEVDVLVSHVYTCNDYEWNGLVGMQQNVRLCS